MLQLNYQSLVAAPNIRPLPIGRRVVLDLLAMYGEPAVTARLFYDIDMTWASQLISRFAEKEVRVTPTALLIKAIALAQKEHPISRSVLLPGERLLTFENITGGFTVEKFVDQDPIVLFGEIASPHERSVGEISKELKEYHESEIDSIPYLKQQYDFAHLPFFIRRTIMWLGTVFPSFRLRYVRSTFGLTSLGSLGTTVVSAPPVSTSVFGIGIIENRMVLQNEEQVVKPMMTVSLNFDHRVMDGAQAARFFLDVKKYMEEGWNEQI